MRITGKLLFVWLLISPLYGHSQERNDDKAGLEWDIALEGMLGFAAGNDFYAFNVGGPTLMLALNKDLKIGVGALPSFYIKEGKTGAKLGVSPRVDYRNFVLIAPFFHFDNPDKWVWSVGMGYKFHKKK